MHSSHNPMALPAGWYAVGTPKEFGGKKLRSTRRFGRNWVIRRDSKLRWIAQEDLCPHRSARLSLGKVTNDCLTCPFHGIQFDASGKAAFVPEIGRDAPGLRIETFELREAHGFLWFPWGGATGEPSWFNDLNERFTHAPSVHQWPQHFSRCVENQLDYSHLPFVHATTIGRGFDPTFKGPCRVDSRGMVVGLGRSPNDVAAFEFRYPNVWMLTISQRFRQTIAFVPVDQEHTRLYLRTYQSFIRIPLLRHLAARALGPFNQLVLGQDYRVVVGQAPRDSRAADHERLFFSDTAIRAFRSWFKQEAVAPAISDDDRLAEG